MFMFSRETDRYLPSRGATSPLFSVNALISFIFSSWPSLSGCTIKDIGSPMTRFSVFSTRQSFTKKTHSLKMFNHVTTKILYYLVSIHLHFSYMLRRNQ